MNRLVRLAVPLVALSASPVRGDWPQFLGPTRNGIADKAEVIPLEFAGGEPEIAWSYSVGSGFAGPAVSGGSVYVFHRVGDRALLDALDAKSGERAWRFGYATDYRDDFGFDNGPRAVPLVADGRVYISGAEGKLHCVAATDGTKLWRRDLRADIDASKGFFGRAPSPLLVGEILVVQAGGDRAGILGLEAATGRTRWKATAHEAGYASPVAAKIAGREVVIAFTREGFACLDPTDGETLIERRHRSATHASVNAASPLFFPPDRVFLSSCYGVGAALWDMDLGAGTVKPVWEAGERLDCHYATPVAFDGHLIGFHGRQESGMVLRCIDAASGDVAWTSQRLPAGTVTLAGKTLLVITERGELILAKASTAGFAPTARGQILGNDTRAFPALSEGRLYARDKRRLVCVKLR